MPNHLGIAKIRNARTGQNRVARIFCPAAPFIQAVSQTLGLKSFSTQLFCPMIVIGKNRYQWRILLSTQATAIGVIKHCTAGKNSAVFIREERRRQMLPMHQILTDCMPPMHGPPNIGIGVLLIKQVILTIQINHPVRVVHPLLQRRKMLLGAISFLIQRRRRRSDQWC